MSDCCTPPKGSPLPAVVQHGRAICPRCGQPGQPVGQETVKAMLAVSLERLHSRDYHFCRTADCRVVYFTAHGTQHFQQEELREPVYQKNPGDEQIFVCYCFRHSPATIRAEIAALGRSTVIEGVEAAIRAGQCACEIRNPQGSCCLGNLRALVKEILLPGRKP